MSGLGTSGEDFSAVAGKAAWMRGNGGEDFSAVAGKPYWENSAGEKIADASEPARKLVESLTPAAFLNTHGFVDMEEVLRDQAGASRDGGGTFISGGNVYPENLGDGGQPYSNRN